MNKKSPPLKQFHPVLYRCSPQISLAYQTLFRNNPSRPSCFGPLHTFEAVLAEEWCRTAAFDSTCRHQRLIACTANPSGRMPVRRAATKTKPDVLERVSLARMSSHPDQWALLPYVAELIGLGTAAGRIVADDHCAADDAPTTKLIEHLFSLAPGKSVHKPWLPSARACDGKMLVPLQRCWRA